MDKTSDFQSIDEYIASFPADVQKTLQELRAVIKAAAPDATEKISYQMPTFFLHGNLVHFAAYKKHIGFYPAPRGIEPLSRSYPCTKAQKARSSSPSTSPCRWSWSAGSSSFGSLKTCVRLRQKLVKADRYCSKRQAICCSPIPGIPRARVSVG